MNKYKKIFSGLGLLSISTLVGASVVACANKKPKASDSSAEGIDQNNNQGNSITPEQEKPESNDQGNSSKPKDEENTPGNPAPEAPKTPENTRTRWHSSSSENSGNTNENDKKDKPSEGMKKEPEKPGKDQTPPVTLEQKLQQINNKIELLTYPSKTAKAKVTLKTKALSFKTIEELNKFDEQLDQIKSKLDEVISNIDKLEYPNVNLNPNKEKSFKNKFKEKLNDKADVKSISEVLQKIEVKKSKNMAKVFAALNGFLEKNNIENLNKRFAQTDDVDKFTEVELIWQIYETTRQKAFEPKIDALKNIDKNKKDEYKKKVENIKDKKLNHQKDVDWLLKNIENLKSIFKMAQNEKKKEVKE
ncbi:hypothetical protein [Mycoplasmopsis cynos]|uniref:hypothetical protein n=2 Tax=Mycoplasmopsis cynos TaxID=171284 RepID=UPI002201B626|nr:hypothetical protein [Mycoplasmopsis cynos]UWV81666.1 hypothetical protein NW065_00620 [Mycoplasmopsis cynos]